MQGGGVCTNEQYAPELPPRGIENPPTYCGSVPPVDDPQALYFLAFILPYMDGQFRISDFGGVIAYDHNCFWKLCEAHELDHETSLLFLRYLKIFEDALITSQAARRGEDTNHGRQDSRNHPEDEL